MKTPIIIFKRLPASGMTIFPFILLKHPNSRKDKGLINHEQIHIRQQLELLILPFYLLYLINYAINLIKYKNHHSAYLNIVFEQEAFAFEKDLAYLKRRKLFAWTHFI